MQSSLGGEIVSLQTTLIAVCRTRRHASSGLAVSLVPEPTSLHTLSVASLPSILKFRLKGVPSKVVGWEDWAFRRLKLLEEALTQAVAAS